MSAILSTTGSLAFSRAFEKQKFKGRLCSASSNSPLTFHVSSDAPSLTVNSVLLAQSADLIALCERSTGLYIPQRLTPLAFTEIYAELSPFQRYRYNQLCGLYFLEQTI